MSPADYAGGGGYSGRRALSQSRIVHHDFPQFHSSSHRAPSNAPIAAAPIPPIHQSSQISLNPPPPYSSASLGHNFRTRSLDHRRFPAAFSSGEYSSGAGGGGAASGRAFYTSFGGGGGGGGIGSASRKAYGQKYTGELFGGGTGAEVAKSVSSSGGGHYRSSSAEKSGVTVVPIRRDLVSTLPSRRMQSEWKSSSSGFAAGGGGGYAVGGPSLIQQQIAAQQQREEEEVEGPKEEYQFERSSKFNQQRQAFQRPMQNFYDRWHRMEMIEGPRSGGAYFPSDTTADYSTFRRSHQAGSDAAAAAAAAESAAQHQKNEQHTRTQQHQREYREYHSGRHQRAAAATAAAADYGTLGTRRSATERHAARGVGTAGNGGGGHHQQQQQYYYREGAYAGGGGGGAEARDLRYQNYRPEHQQQQQHYANGWTGGGGQQHQQYHQHHMRRSASAGGGGGGFFGTGRKSKSSKSSGARWSATQKTDHPQGPKRYRKIRVCCFNMIWPPWAVEPSGPPRPIYGRSKASGSPTPIPVEHRPPPFYAAGEGLPPPGPHPQSAFVGPPPQHPENVAPASRAIPNDVAGGYGPEYRGVPPPAAHGGGGGGIHGPPPPNQPGRDVPDYRVPMHVPSDYQGYRAPVGGGPPPAPAATAAGVGMQAPQKHDYRHPREIPVQYQQPLPQSSRRE